MKLKLCRFKASDFKKMSDSDVMKQLTIAEIL